MSQLLGDLRLAARRLRRTPGLTVTVLLSLGLGVGVNTTVFAWLDNLVRRPLPGVPDSGELVALNVADPDGRVEGMPAVSYPTLLEWTSRTRSFAAVAAHSQARMNLRDGLAEAGEPIWTELTASTFFSTLRVTPALGRFYTGADEANHASVVVLSHAFWQRRFGGQTDVLGRRVLLNGTPLTVVGVTSRGFGGVVTGLGFDAWIPLWMQPDLLPGGDWMRDRGTRRLQAIARLHPGVSLVQARLELHAAALDVSRAYGESPPTGAGARWLSDTQLGSLLGSLGGAMLAVTVVVLLAVTANVTGLLLALGVRRQRDTAVQLALGASRLQLVRGALAQAGLLSLAGCALGVWLAQTTKDALIRFVPRVALPVHIEVSLNWRVLLFAALATSLAATIASLVPALRTARVNVVDTLKSGGGGGGRSRLRATLLVAQVAFAVMALATAGLFLRSVASAASMPLGFGDPARVLLVSTDLSFTRLASAAKATLVSDALDRVRALPSVSAASFASFVPLSFGGPPSASTTIEGYVPGSEESMFVDRAIVTEGYVETLALPLEEGRAFTTADGVDGPRVVLVNRALATRYWPGRSALGRRLDQGDGWAMVVGVVGNAAVDTVNGPPRPLVYVPWRQRQVDSLTLHVRTAAGPLTVLEPVRQVFFAVHRDLPVLDPGLLSDHMRAALFVQSLGASTFSLFGAIAVLVATVGLYGSVAQYVAERRREIAVTVALGASPTSVALSVIGRATRLTAVGLVVGAMLAIVAARSMRAQLIGVETVDSASLAGSAALLLLTAVCSCAWPAWRASRTDPVITIRPS